MTVQLPTDPAALDYVHWLDIDRIPGFMTQEECACLARLAREANSWTEVGVYCGRSALCVALYLPKGAWLHLVDINLGTILRAGQSFLTTYQQIVQRRPDLKLMLYRMPSVEAAAVVPKADVVFIDACHDYHSVRDDIQFWRKKAVTLCGHDYHDAWPGVKQAVEELCPGFRNEAGSIWIA